jgi:AmmeMemoRadiSam system protein A
MKDILTNIVKKSIQERFEHKPLIDKELILQNYPELNQQKATFVTLNMDNNLRGCIGSIIAHRTFLEDLIENAKSAAFGDPRFLPLSKEEFEKIDIEISILTEPQEITYDSIDDLKNKVEVGIDGIIIIKGDFQSTFLPQVWEQLPTFDSFFEHLCQKAGMHQNCLDYNPIVYKYQVEKI